MRIGGIRERRLVLSFERRRVVERCSDDSPDKLGLGVQLASCQAHIYWNILATYGAKRSRSICLMVVLTCTDKPCSVM